MEMRHRTTLLIVASIFLVTVSGQGGPPVPEARNTRASLGASAGSPPGGSSPGSSPGGSPPSGGDPPTHNDPPGPTGDAGGAPGSAPGSALGGPSTGDGAGNGAQNSPAGFPGSPPGGNEETAPNTESGGMPTAGGAAGPTATGPNNVGGPSGEQGNDGKGQGQNDMNEENDHKIIGYTGTRTRVLACEGATAVLTCPPETTIWTEYALWGRSDSVNCNDTWYDLDVTCDSGFDAVNRMIGQCDNKETCTVTANINTFGDPCENRTNLYLVAEYSCKEKVYDALVCEASGKLPLTCPGDQVIKTGRAFWGRANMNTTCPHPTTTPTDNCSNPDASYIFRQLCDGKTDCEVDATDHTFGDPCPGSYKYLSMYYTCEDCVNLESDVECEMLAMEGECFNNPDWMMEKCRKACTKCGKEKQVCYNRWFNDTNCDKWAADGDCDSNPIWMMAYCKASCTGCNKKTSCKNRVADTDCQTWGDDLQCLSNVYWMFPNCTAYCFHCDLDGYDTVRCDNRHDDDECDLWAAFGLCDRNPGYMMTNCMQSCTGCERDPVCSNVLDDSQCNEWARVGECERNVVWMHQKCWKACLQCEGPRECVNRNGDDAMCEYRAYTGMILSNPTYMTRECWKTVSGCVPSGQSAVSRRQAINKPDCINRGDTDLDCDFWSAIDECSRNPGYMYDKCYKSCSFCDLESQQLQLLGNPPTPGKALPSTAYSLVMLPDVFPYYSKLTHFTAFFTALTPVHLQILRWNTTGGYYWVIYSKQVQPDVINTAQTIKIDDCVMLQWGDRIAFRDFYGNGNIAATPDEDPTENIYMMKGSTNSLAFNIVGLPYKFSIGAGYSTYETC